MKEEVASRKFINCQTASFEELMESSYLCSMYGERVDLKKIKFSELKSQFESGVREFVGFDVEPDMERCSHLFNAGKFRLCRFGGSASIKEYELAANDSVEFEECVFTLPLVLSGDSSTSARVYLSRFSESSHITFSGRFKHVIVVGPGVDAYLRVNFVICRRVDRAEIKLGRLSLCLQHAFLDRLSIRDIALLDVSARKDDYIGSFDVDSSSLLMSEREKIAKKIVSAIQFNQLVWGWSQIQNSMSVRRTDDVAAWSRIAVRRILGYSVREKIKFRYRFFNVCRGFLLEVTSSVSKVMLLNLGIFGLLVVLKHLANCSDFSVVRLCDSFKKTLHNFYLVGASFEDGYLDYITSIVGLFLNIALAFYVEKSLAALSRLRSYEVSDSTPPAP
jgi:hypothetical protein